MLCLFLLGTGTGNMIPHSDKILETVTRQHQQLSHFPTQGLRCLPSSSLLGFQHCRGETLHWSDLWRGRKVWRRWFSHSGHWLTPARVPFLQHWWSIRIGLLHEHPINGQDSPDIELAQVCICFRHVKTCSMLCSFLLWTATGNMIPGSNRVPGSRLTAGATKHSSQHKVWGVCQAQACSWKP